MIDATKYVVFINQITSIMNAKLIWNKGYKGKLLSCSADKQF